MDHLDDSTCNVEDDDIALPSDEEKPRVAYIEGWRFTAQKHVPPPIRIRLTPLWDASSTAGRGLKMEGLSPFERCHQYPPLPGPYGSSSLELQVHETIRIGDHHNSQVLLVEILTANSVKGLSPGQYAVAQLYDPNNMESDFYDWIDWDWQPWLQAEFANTAESITPVMIELYMPPFFLENINNNMQEGLRLVIGGHGGFMTNFAV